MLPTTSPLRSISISKNSALGVLCHASTVVARLLALAFSLMLLPLGGCAGPALHDEMTDAQYRQVLAENFQPGMSLDQVKAELKALHVSTDYSHLYPATPARPEVYLVRTWPYTGPWGQFGPDSNIEFVDVSFVFGGPGNALQRTAIYRDSYRTAGGQIMYGPNRPTMGPIADWTAELPPPADPLEGAS